MKRTIYLLILGFLFCTQAFGQTVSAPQYVPARQDTGAQTGATQQLPQGAGATTAPAVQPIPKMAGLPNPALVGLQSLRVTALYYNSRLGVDNFLWADITARAERRMAESDPRLAILIQRGYEYRYMDIPTLIITVDKFILSPTRPPIIYVQTALEASITSQRTPNTVLRTMVWSLIETIQAESVQAEFAAASSLVYKQIDRFVYDFVQANAAVTFTPEPNDVNIVPQKTVPAPAAKPPKKPKEITPKEKPVTPVNLSFLSSTSSTVFHKSDCSFAKNIAPKNLVTYASRDEAIAAGKRPCKKCNP